MTKRLIDRRAGTQEVRDAPDRPGLAARRVAARVLAAIVERQVSADGLMDPQGGSPEFRGLPPRDQSLVRAIVTTALRFRGTIAREVSSRLERPLPSNARHLEHLLHVAAAQILFLDIPDSAAVDLAVEAAGADPRSRRFAGLVNAVLRRIARETPEGGPDIREMENCPPWLAGRLAAIYGEVAAARIAAAHAVPAPLDLTVKNDPEGWARRLGGAALATGTVRLAGGEMPVPEIEGYSAGQWWVQDAAAALPARLFGPVAGLSIADLCAAPGGKTAQLAAAGARVTALDISASRMKRLQANLERLSLAAETHVASLEAFSPAELFDGVLLDAPCSSTGTIRRHPDVAWTKGPEEIEKLAGVQARLLGAAARLVKPGGLLVFSNCSLDPIEGEAVVEAFLRQAPEFRREPVTAAELPGLDGAVSAAGDVRTTPAMLTLAEPRLSGLDGFYAARLRRDQTSGAKATVTH